MNLTSAYRAVMQAILQQRGKRCEACGKPAHHPHHIIPVSETSIHSALVVEPANILILCDDCHCLFHPGRRVYPWLMMQIGRGRALRQ